MASWLDSLWLFAAGLAIGSFTVGALWMRAHLRALNRNRNGLKHSAEAYAREARYL